MRAIVKRIKAGKYIVNQNGYSFELCKNDDNKWMLFNHAGIELYKDDSKQAIINMISSYTSNGCRELHLQQYCTYA